MKLQVIYKDSYDEKKGKLIEPKAITIIDYEIQQLGNETVELFHLNINTQPEFIYCLITSKLGLADCSYEKFQIKNVNENIQYAFNELTIKLTKHKNKCVN